MHLFELGEEEKKIHLAIFTFIFHFKLILP
jgi:hypothetical protein